ncbi:MAG: TonB-dependent receptor, partial [Candidatus Omnitrophota bacterium]
MFRKILVIFFSVVVLTGFQGSVFAEEEKGGSLPLDVKEKERFVYTPYRTYVPARLSSVAIDDINRKSWEAHQIYSLPDILRFNSSTQVASSGIAGPTGVFLRGHDSAHTRFLLDGVKLYDPIVTAAYYSPVHFDAQGLEDIEIVKGPQSTLYGSDAIGGVIALHSKSPLDKPESTVLQELGQDGTYNTRVGISQAAFTKNGDLGIGYDFAGNNINYLGSARQSDSPERDPYHNINSQFKVDYELDDLFSAGFTQRLIWGEYEYDGWRPHDDDTNRGDYFEQIYALNMKHRITDHVCQRFTLGFTGIHRSGDEDSNTSNWYDGKTQQFNYNLGVKVFDFSETVGGIDYIREFGDYWRVDQGLISDYDKESIRNIGYYVEQNMIFADSLFLNGSLRWDHHQRFGWQNTWKASGAYALDWLDIYTTKARASYGTGFKAPSLYQLYGPGFWSWGTFCPVGVSGLSPERSETFEIGGEQSIGDNVLFGANYFNSLVKNRIDYAWNMGYFNNSKATIEGFELFFNYMINDAICLNFGYTHLKTRNKDNGKWLARRPEDKATLELVVKPVEKLRFATDISYVDI